MTALDDRCSGLRGVPDVLAMTGTVGDYLNAATEPIRALSSRFEEVNAVLAAGPSEAEERRLAREFDELLAQMETADGRWSYAPRVKP